MAERSKPDAVEVARWQAPRMGTAPGSQDLYPAGPLAPPTAADIEAWEEASREEGARRGYEEGLAAARAQCDAELTALGAIVARMRDALSDFDAEAEQQLVRLSVVLAQQLVRREMRTEPGEVVAVIREALRLLPAAAREVRVHLHPQDLPLVSGALGAGGGEGGVELCEDPRLTRGGCVVTSESSRIDATLESRLAALAASALGGERESDRGPGDE